MLDRVVLLDGFIGHFVRFICSNFCRKFVVVVVPLAARFKIKVQYGDGLAKLLLEMFAVHEFGEAWATVRIHKIVAHQIPFLTFARLLSYSLILNFIWNGVFREDSGRGRERIRIEKKTIKIYVISIIYIYHYLEGMGKIAATKKKLYELICLGKIATVIYFRLHSVSIFYFLAAANISS